MDLVDALRRSRFKGSGRMAFLAQREAIARALAAGATKKAVWQWLQAQGHMPISYEHFVAYTRRYIERGGRSVSEHERTSEQGQTGSREPVVPRSPRFQQFSYPGKASDKDELV